MDEALLLPLFPLNTVLLPGIALPLHVFEERYKQMIAACLAHSGQFGVVLIAEGQEVGAPATPHLVGTTARIVTVEQLADARMNLMCVGEQRFKIVELVPGRPYQRALVTYWPDTAQDCDPESVALGVRHALRGFLSAGQESVQELPPLPENPADLASMLSASLPMDLLTRQALLEEPGLCSRLSRIAEILRVEAAVVRAVGAQRFITSRPGPFSVN